MRHYVSSCRAQGQGPACAILEMPETLKGEIGDPYPASKRAIAQAGLLPQVVLNPRPAKKDDFPEKIVAAVADSLRMLGVSPIAPLDLTLAGIGRIRRTGKEVLGIRTNSQVIPVAVRLRGDLLEAKLLRARNWIPYAQAVLQVLSGEYDRLSWKREDRAATERFCAEVLQELNRASRTLVFIEHDRSDLQTLNNGKLTFDSLTLAGRRFSTQDLSNLTVIRIYTDPRKLPAYFHDEGASWTTGLWNWGQQRTFYGLKRKPPTALRGAWFATISRRTGSRSDAETRLTPPIDEICVVLKQEDTDPLAMARIAHKLQGCHIQYKYDTRIQFPLHEAILLERNVTFSPT